jgi:RNA polymerase sigma-70 factor, ECF subfamily
LRQLYLQTMNPSEPTPTTGCGGETAAAGSLVLDWPAILAAHEDWLRHVITARVQERQAVDEVMQEVALAALAQRSPLINPARMVGWLYRLAVRQALIYRRKAGRQRALVGRYARTQATGGEDPALSPLGWLLHDERRGMVQQALHRLPPRDADLLVLKYAEGWSARELAGRLGVKTAAVEARLHRARGRLRAELAALATVFAAAPDDADNGKP